MNVFDLFNGNDVQIDDSCQTQGWKQGTEDTNWDVVEWISVDYVQFFQQHTCKIVPMDAYGKQPYFKNKWISNEMSDGCSECGYPFDTVNRGVPNYCANCGAKVDRIE